MIGVRPVAFSDLGYFLTPWAAAVIVYFGHRLHRGGTALESRLFDLGNAAALGLFSVTGTVKALSHGFDVPAAVTLGAASAVGGGVLSSLLALEVPPLLRWNTDLYAVPALAGGVVVTLLRAAGRRYGRRGEDRRPAPAGVADAHPADPPRPPRRPSARRVAPTGPTARTATPGTGPVAAGAAGRTPGPAGVVTPVSAPGEVTRAGCSPGRGGSRPSRCATRPCADP
ncbi:TRIC cation channel family protein [Streptomyces coelicoflavus]|uniref:TRIC cation channel family protein n=1 Tax=Streptomyces coelicoflavus TaxID=285562 RepID=UPI003633974B